MADFNNAIAAMKLQNNQRWDAFQQRFDVAQEENRKNFLDIYERMDKMDHQVNFLCNTNQFMNEDLLYPYQQTKLTMRDMQERGILITIENLKINRQRVEEMRMERERYQRILEEAATQKAKEQNKGEARREEEESEDEDSEPRVKSERVKSGLGHGMLWTKVFEYLGLDLSSEEAIPVGEDNAITQRQLNQMRRNLNVGGTENIADKAGDRDVPHHPDVNSAQQFPPELMESFSQGVQSFRSAWGENLLNLGKRLDGFDDQLTRQVEEIHGLGKDVMGWFNQFLRSDDQGFHGNAPDQD
ncbi:hypothetical protein PIB30_046504 [Stylosanthes scabra]|uniref:Uncharacterized protein n=1 Tax=Stylosanthes scabra TaxID=79078 RepID=A0ABU6XGR9_9FABA|nr:hypothetical protein [Stylosanthes scabra]